jgi:CHAT domain-containing protein
VEFSSNILLQQPAVATNETQRKHISRHLRPALRAVWNNILLPIFTKLGVSVEHSAVAPQQQIWWYPTGPLTFIPIHAASSGCKGATDVSRLIISSYITSLNSLLQVQERNRQSKMHGLKLLAVSQPNTAGLCPLPQSTVEVEKLVEAAYLAAEGCSKEDILHLSGSDATVNHVSAALESSSWVHFACHGFQDTALGMKSAFALHDGNLELGEIARKRLPNAQFAFLSACHAASGLNKQPGEAMHLAAGFLFAGFSSVVATKWGICDEDAPKVAVNTYKYLFRNGMQQLDPSEAAKALNHAILLLREDPNVSVDRWAPFIHLGI